MSKKFVTQEEHYRFDRLRFRDKYGDHVATILASISCDNNIFDIVKKEFFSDSHVDCRDSRYAFKDAKIEVTKFNLLDYL